MAKAFCPWAIIAHVQRLLPLLLLAACSDNRAPVFDPPPVDQSVTVGRTLLFEVKAIDRDGDEVSYGARGLPVGSIFDRDQEPPVFRWTPLASDAAADGRPYPITFIAQDEAGAQTEARVLLTIFSGGSRPTFTSPSAFVLDLRVSPTLVATIAVRDDDSTEVDFRLLEAPPGAELQPGPKQARLTWTPTPEQLDARRVYGVRVAAWDEAPEDFVEQEITIVVDGG